MIQARIEQLPQKPVTEGGRTYGIVDRPTVVTGVETKIANVEEDCSRIW